MDGSVWLTVSTSAYQSAFNLGSNIGTVSQTTAIFGHFFWMLVAIALSVCCVHEECGFEGTPFCLMLYKSPFVLYISTQSAIILSNLCKYILDAKVLNLWSLYLQSDFMCIDYHQLVHSSLFFLRSQNFWKALK